MISAIKSLLLLGLIVFASQALAEDVFVKVRSTKLKADSKHWSNALTTLAYGERLSVLKKDKEWLEVKDRDGKVGYVHVSAVSDRKVVIKGSANYFKEQNSDDVVIAGKGFSKEVEKDLASNNSELDFKAVDRMEQIRVSEKDLASFINSGKLG